MNQNQYQLAGWLAIIGAIIMVPLTIGSILLNKVSGGHPLTGLLFIGRGFISMLVTVYIYYMFRKLLNERYNFHLVDWIISAFIGFSVFFFLISLIGLIPDLTIAIAITGSVIMIPIGILSIIFGMRMLKLNDDLFGFLKLFAYLNIASGIFAVSVILMPLGMLTGIATLLIEGIIFLRTKEQVEFI